MVIDTADAAALGDPFGDYRRFRNMIGHEAGHGFGLAHVESATNGFLMEPFIQVSFDGPATTFAVSSVCTATTTSSPSATRCR